MIKLLSKIFGKKEKAIDLTHNWMFKDGSMVIDRKTIMRHPSFKVLSETQQSAKWHAEGNVLNHTFLVVEEMAKLFRQPEWWMITEYDKRVLLTAALCHDLGKATTTYYDKIDEDWKCKNHGFEGEKITREILRDDDPFFREQVCWLVRWHMAFHHLLDKDEAGRLSELTRLSRGITDIHLLLMLFIADSLGSRSETDAVEYINKTKDTITALSGKIPEPTKPSSPFTVAFMIGLPGSGKDTTIKRDTILCHRPTVCRDDIRETMEKVDEEKVTETVNSLIRQYCEEGKSFVINQTSLKRKYRDDLKREIFRYARPRIVYYYVDAPMSECMERRGHGKWDGIIRRMYENFEFPDLSECDNFIFITNTNKNPNIIKYYK